MKAKALISMAVTVTASVAVYYLFTEVIALSENLSMTAGVVVAIACSVGFKKVFK